MTQSHPSKKAVIVDVPEVTNVNANFVYNFFVPNERLSGSLSTVEKSIAAKISQFDQSTIATSIASYSRFIPRYIELSWEPIITATDKNTTAKIASQISIAANVEKIYDEETFSVDDFSNVTFQDSQIDGKIQFYTSRLIQDIINKNPTMQLDANGNQKQLSQMDITSFVNNNTSNNLTPGFLQDALSNQSNLGFRYLDQSNQEIVTNNILQKLATVKTDMQINKKFLHTVLQTSKENPINLYYDDISNDFLDKALSLQQNAVQNNPSTTISGQDYDIQIKDFVDLRVVDSDFYESESHIVGYLIEKTEITSEGKQISHKPLIVESPFVGKTIDFNIKYGSYYMYKIYAVATFNIRTVNVDTSQVVAVTFLVRSKPVLTKQVECSESVVPPGPADFNVNWDYIKRKPVICWNFPVNPQRDIKYFQVFRRKTINEPFELIAMYDFDDSDVKTEMLENNIRGYRNTVADSLVHKTNITNYVDLDFVQDSSKYIYSVCCVDAHGYSSNYGPQLEVSFNRNTNTIEKRLISRSGAPKPYPNLYLLQDLFVDTIKTSGTKKMHIYFTPEYIDVYQNKNGKKSYLELINAHGTNSYQLQLINVDLQKQQFFTINLSDIRKNTI